MRKAITRDRGISTAETIAQVPSNAAIHMVQSSRTAQRLAKLLILGLLFAILAMALLPWQQTSRGTGKVLALDPQERPQPVEAPVKGIVLWVNPRLADGVEVTEGEELVRLQPEAANLEQQLKQQEDALREKLRTAEEKIAFNEALIAGFRDAGVSAVGGAREMVEAARAKLESKRKLIESYKSKLTQANLNSIRQRKLANSGISSEKVAEKAEKELGIATAELQSIYDDVDALKMELSAKQQSLQEKTTLAKTKVDAQKEKLASAEGLIFEVEKQIADLASKQDKLNRNVITAPRSGKIQRMSLYSGMQSVKEGQELMMIVPETTTKAVALSINGNDLPLVQLGQEVRLQFEGWPAVQFAGWPSIAIGTFSGKVVTIDPTDNGKGEFRILVAPNEDIIENDSRQVAWPEDRYLRQGVRANGWVMLNKVSLGYEIWRQLNGFPVMLDEAPKKSDSKPPKLPK